MTPKQQRFIQEYLIDLNATQAAIRAGYSPTSAKLQGHRMITNDNVLLAIQAAQAKKAEQFELTQEKVLKGLLTEAERTDDGSSHGARVSAWTQLGKHLAMFTDVVERRNTVTEMDDAELEDIATAGRKGAAGQTNGATGPDSVH